MSFNRRTFIKATGAGAALAALPARDTVKQAQPAPARGAAPSHAATGGATLVARTVVPWCSGLAYVPVKDEIGGSNPLGTARVQQTESPPYGGLSVCLESDVRHSLQGNDAEPCTVLSGRLRGLYTGPRRSHSQIGRAHV